MNQTQPENYEPQTLTVGFAYSTLVWFIY